MNVVKSAATFLSCIFAYYVLNIANNTMAATSQSRAETSSVSSKQSQPTQPQLANSPDGSANARKFVKLTMRQGLLMNQVIATYALNNAENKLCKNHTEEFKDGLRAFEAWAVLMFDSSSKVQSSILMGNLVEYGAFRQCLRIYKSTNSGPIRGKHCSFRITPGPKLMRTVMGFKNVSDKRYEMVKSSVVEGIRMIWSVCVPDSCPASDVLSHFNKSIMELAEGLDVTVSLKENNCATLQTTPQLTPKEYCFLAVAVTILLMITISTIIELRSPDEDPNQFVTIFSIISNGKRLFGKGGSSSELDCVHGIRSISVCYVLFGHRYMTAMMFPEVNSFDLLEWILKYTSTIIIGGTVCVDSFFFVSGTLVGYGFFETVTKTGKFSLVLYYVHRYIRITPSLAVAVIVYSSFIQHFGSGPIWREICEIMQKPCQYYWWSALLHIQNYVNPKLLCVPQTWYLSCEMIYYYFAPLLLYPLWKWPNFGYANFVLIYIASVAINFYFAWINEYVGGMPLTNQLLMTKYFQQHYIAPHVRASPYVIGLFFGYVIFKTKGKKVKINFATNFACWILTIVVMTATVVGSHAFQDENHDYNRLESSIYLSCHRSAWTLGLVWIIWACIHGYAGIINQVLSLHVFRVLGRIGYGIYLFHMCFQYLRDASAKLAGYFSDSRLIYDCCADLIVMSLFGIVFTLTFEYPCLNLEAALLGKNKKRASNKVTVVAAKA